MYEIPSHIQKKLQKKFKIFKLKALRAWHRFDRQTGTTRFLKKAALVSAIKIITTVMPNAQISLHAQNVDRNTYPKALLAKASPMLSDASFEEFKEYSRSQIAERQTCFAKDLYETLKDNVEEVKDGAKHGHKTRTLKQLFGKDVDPRYYCAIGGLKSLEQTIEKKGYPEYDFLLKCINNPHACQNVIASLEKNFGSGAKTNNIRNKLRDILKNNSSSVCIAIVNSTRNTRSGKHFVFVLPNKVVVDSLINETDTLKGKVVSFNVDKIAASDDYFTGTKNTGYLFNITEMSELDLMMLFYDKFNKEKHVVPQQEKFSDNMIQASLGNLKPKRAPRKKSLPENPRLWSAISNKEQSLG